MSKYIGPTCKLARRERHDLGLKLRPMAKKCNLKKLPGKKEGARMSYGSEYGLQLREKQKIKRIYNIREHHIKRYYLSIRKTKGDKAVNMLALIESRLDNVVYRLGFAFTRAHARQLVSHKAVLVNNLCCNRPSRSLKPNDEVQLKPKAQKQQYVGDAIKHHKGMKVPSWLSCNLTQYKGAMVDVPSKETVMSVSSASHRVIEFYSSKK